MIRAIAAGLLLAGVAVEPAAGAFPDGAAGQTLTLNGVEIETFTYRPAGFEGERMIVVMHGSGRTADKYRDAAKDLGRRHRALIVAPRFDRSRFSQDAYYRAGIGADGPPDRNTGALVLALIERVRREEAKPSMTYLMIGHSAGGQFLSRFAAFVPNEAKRIVIANPSAYVRASLESGFPYGLAGLSDGVSGEARLKAYLAAPITIYLGTADTGSKGVEMTPPAIWQGFTWLQRGRNVFAAAQKTAADRGWTFAWRLIEAEGVGHSASRMFRNPAAGKALFPD